MAKAIFDGLTMKQAKTLVNWFEGQGEQDCYVWFEENNVPSPLVDVRQKYVVDEQAETITAFCRTPKAG